MDETGSLYPASTEYRFGVKPANKEVSELEYENTLKQVPLLEKRLEHLTRRIEFYADVDSVPVDLAADPAGHRNVLAMHKLMKAELTGEREELLALIKSAAKR
jgi:hypothetical protein